MDWSGLATPFNVQTADWSRWMASNRLFHMIRGRRGGGIAASSTMRLFSLILLCIALVAQSTVAVVPVAAAAAGAVAAQAALDVLAELIATKIVYKMGSSGKMGGGGGGSKNCNCHFILEPHSIPAAVAPMFGGTPVAKY